MGAALPFLEYLMLFGLVSFLGALLLGFLQFSVAKAVTPWFGGGSHAWLTCLFFFLGMLLAGSGYAHLLLTRVPSRRQGWVNSAVLLLALVNLVMVFLFSGFAREWSQDAGDHPSLIILRILVVALGFPMLALTSIVTLAQHWFFRQPGHPSPFRLFMWFGAGLLVALILYPSCAEPFLGLRSMAWVLGILMLPYLSIVFWLWLRTRKQVIPPKTITDRGHPVKRHTWLLWTFVAFAASWMLAAATQLLASECPGLPFLTMLPPACYLLSLILVFDGRIPFDRAWIQYLLYGVFATAVWVLPWMGRPLGFTSILLVLLFCGCLLCHGMLYALRPIPHKLSRYYLAATLGVVLGQVLVWALTPLFLNRIHEYPVSMLLLGIVAFLSFHLEKSRLRYLRLLPVAACLVLAQFTFLRKTDDGNAYRDLYGMMRVQAQGRTKVLRLGPRILGAETLSKPLLPLAYYQRESGFGRVMGFVRKQKTALKLGLLGLGAGNAAAYAQAQDEIDIYEISPRIIQLAGGEAREFDILNASRARWTLKVGDGRMLLERQRVSQSLDVLLVDSVGSPALPWHLYTLEALKGYLGDLDAQGFLVIHTTHAPRLDRLLFAQAKQLGVSALLIECPSAENRARMDRLELPSRFVVLSRDPASLLEPALLNASSAMLLPLGTTLAGDAGVTMRLERGAALCEGMHPWTDDRSSLLR